MPMIFTLRRSNSGLIRAMYPSFVVQTGVKSFGCETRIAHGSPIQSLKLIVPSVVSAVKSGAGSLIVSAIYRLLRGDAPLQRERSLALESRCKQDVETTFRVALFQAPARLVWNEPDESVWLPLRSIASTSQ